MKYYIKTIVDVGNRPQSISMSYRKMAKYTGYNYSYLQKFLTGKIILPKDKFDKIIAKCCGKETTTMSLEQPEPAEGIEEFKSNFPTKEQVVYIVDKEIGTWNFTEYFEEKLKQFIFTQITKARKEEREKIALIAEKNKYGTEAIVNEVEYVRGYNDALKDLIIKLT